MSDDFLMLSVSKWHDFSNAKLDMPRKNLIHSKTHPYHVTARSNNREQFYCSLQDSWKIFSNNLAEISEIHQIKVHAFVLMPNHFHLLISTPVDDLGTAMQRFISSVTKTMNLKSGRTGRVFGARYNWSLINTDGYFDYALKYVYRNPVKANLVSRVEDYPFSSIGKVLEMSDLAFPIFPPIGNNSLLPNQQKKEFITWMNQPFKKEQEESLRKGLRKTQFSPPRTGWKRNANDHLYKWN